MRPVLPNSGAESQYASISVAAVNTQEGLGDEEESRKRSLLLAQYIASLEKRIDVADRV